MIKAAFFDFDGLILDTESALYGAWERVYARFGVALPLPLWAANIGGYSYETFHPLDHLESLLGRPVDREGINSERRAWYRAHIKKQPPMPGVVAALAEARCLGLRLAVVSSSERSWVAGHLERLGLLDNFEFVLCGDEVARVKPDPELYLAAIARMNLAPEQILALEDSPKGVAAAKAARLYCVAAPNPVTESLELGAADRRIDSLASIPFGRLVRETEEHMSREV